MFKFTERPECGWMIKSKAGGWVPGVYTSAEAAWMNMDERGDRPLLIHGTECEHKRHRFVKESCIPTNEVTNERLT